MIVHKATILLAMLLLGSGVAAADCSGISIEKGGQNLLELQDKSFATFARMSVNVDGAGRAYHSDGYAKGAIIHLCGIVALTSVGLQY
jgi:hypothetical protein